MIGRTLQLPPAIRDEIERRALSALPRECCGVLLGNRAGDATLVIDRCHAENVHPEAPERRYSIAPESLLEAARVSRSRGLEIVGFYHSHPSGDARPSQFDRESAWRGASYLILGVRQGGAGSMRSWRLGGEGAGFLEETIRYADRSPVPERTSEP